MSDQPDQLANEAGRPRRDADTGREPQFVAAQMGARWISLNALAERIEAAFIEEHANETAALREADTRTKRLQLVISTLDYVVASESVQLSASERADLVSRVYSALFGYGPLDALFMDERITTLSLEGADAVSVRYEHGQLQPLGPLFQTEEQFRRVLRRLLMDANAELREDQPYIEAGLTIGERPICVNMIAPPVSFQLTADIRMHPKKLPTLADLVAQEFLTETAAAVVQALAQSAHGVIVVGESESGKTTLLNVVAHLLPAPEQVSAVERAGEMRLPAGMSRLAVQWPQGTAPGITFGEQILSAIRLKPQTLLLDEVRTDEPETIAPLLMQADAPRQIWSFRGAIFAKRLQSSLGMLARRADPSGGERLVKALYERLPFVLTLSRSGERLRLSSIAEWQFKHSADYPTYTLLMHTEDGQLRFTGESPLRSLNLPSDFWPAP
jgi:Flp pilus assembly CpaF family ATPase